MAGHLKIIVALSISAMCLLWAAEKPAQAISVELAKKCRAMALKAHPYKLPGVNGPGTAAAERDYFSKCVANGGNMPEQNSSSNKDKGTSQGNAAGSVPEGSSEHKAPPTSK